MRKTPIRDEVAYDDVLAVLEREPSSVLLGNGFSIACDRCFDYASLYDRAVENGLNERAQELFDRLGTNNFEGAMRLLDQCLWVNELYGCSSHQSETLLAANESIKGALINALSASHLEDQSLIRDGGVSAANAFLSRFDKVFTTNYDLLSYWALMDSEERHNDWFRRDPKQSDSVVFDGAQRPERALYFVHGAIHLFTESKETRKHSFRGSGTKLTTIVNEGLKKHRYPLFVAEGNSEKKQQQIDDNHYLSHCLDEFRLIEGPLVVYGFSFDESDAHIATAIARNERVRRMYVSYYGDFDDADNTELQARVCRIQKARGKGRKPLAVSFFDSSDAEVWGGTSCRSAAGW